MDRVRAWAAGPWPGRVVLAATWLVVAVGAMLRIRQWWYARAFWLDELLLLRAMRAQTFGELLSPLDYAQSAPPGWLAVQHVMVGLGDGGERAARLLPLLFGIGALVLVALLGRLLFSGPAALAATVLAAAAPNLIGYSSEFKQYSADAFFVMLVVWLAARLALRRADRDRDRMVFGLAAAVTVWFSHAGALATGGAFLGLGLLALGGRRWRALLVLIGCSLPYAAGLGIEYATLLSANADNDVLQDFWASTFPPDGPLTWAVVGDWAFYRVQAVTANPIVWDRSWPVLAVVLGGLAVLLLRRPRAVPVLVLPVAAIAAAGLAGSYPIANRLALWTVPLAAVVAAGLLDLPFLAARAARAVRLPAALRQRARLPHDGRFALPLRVPLVALALVVAVVAADQLASMAGPLVRADRAQLAQPREQEESRAMLEYAAAHRQPGDAVLVDGGGARNAGIWYAPRVRLGPYQLLINEQPSSFCPREWFGDLLRRDSDARRVWLMTSHTTAAAIRMYIQHLGQFGPLTERLAVPGAQLLRFDRAVAEPPDPTIRPRQCLRGADPASVP